MSFKLVPEMVPAALAAADRIKDLIFVLAEDEPYDNDVERLGASRRKFEAEMAQWDAVMSGH